MMKGSTRFISLILASLMIVSAAGCSAPAAVPSTAPQSGEISVPSAAPVPNGPAKKFSVGVGTTGGMFYVMGAGWATALNNKLAGQYEITAEQTGGAPANVSMLETGEIEFGHGGTSALADAYAGTGSWTNGVKYTKLRAIFPMFTMSLTPFSLKENDITSLQDLNGKRVGLGSKGSGVDSTCRAIFDELGIKPADIHNDTWGATITALQDGAIDAVITQQVAPWPSLTELEATKAVVLIEMTDEELQKIQDMYPFYTPAVIPAGAYKANPDKDIKTVCEWAFMQASADVPDDDVYNIVKATFECYDDLQLVHAGLAGVLAENAAEIPVTWHPGAVKYYEEKSVKLQTPNPMFTPQN